MGNNRDNNNKSIATAVRETGSNLSAKEAMRISNQTGASTAQIFARAQKQGVGIGSAAINKFNEGKLGTNFATQVQGPYGISYNPRADAKTSRALSQLGAIQGLQLQPKTSYRGYSTTNGQYNPIVLPKDILKSSGMASSQQQSPLPGMTDPFASRSIPGVTPGPWAGGYKFAGDTTAATTQPDTTQPIDTAPKTVEEMQQESTGDPYGFLGASSWRGSKKGRGKGIKSTSAASRNIRNSPYSVSFGLK